MMRNNACVGTRPSSFAVGGDIDVSLGVDQALGDRIAREPSEIVDAEPLHDAGAVVGQQVFH